VITLLGVTTAQRLVVTHWLRMAWQGTAEQVDHMLELFDAFRCEELRTRFTANGSINVEGLALGEERQVELSEGALRLVATYLPAAPTPADAGPAKARLLRAVRAVLPAGAEPA
jgi:hypothetical protein